MHRKVQVALGVFAQKASQIAIGEDTHQSVVVVFDHYRTGTTPWPRGLDEHLSDAPVLMADSAFLETAHQFVDRSKTASQRTGRMQFGEIVLSKRFVFADK